ncbi:MAG: hypothetical protein JNM62_02520 [Flavobacteriales bacterium]|nr:hypothetical protein [Flavobacteriales bacterium]
MRRALVFASALASGMACAQVEGVYVERLRTEGPHTTYRIFIDLEEGRVLQTVYGDVAHALTLSTTTTFWNDSTHGVPFGERLKAAALRKGSGWTDSFLAFGFASDAHKAIPLHLDTDGSVHPCNATNARCPNDGLLAVERVPDVVNMNVATGYVDAVSGNLIRTDNGGWGVLGGVKGATPENLVLIAQLTTDGTLSYALNVQVREPDGTVLRCTPDAAASTEEHQQPLLRGTLIP